MLLQSQRGTGQRKPGKILFYWNIPVIFDSGAPKMWRLSRCKSSDRSETSSAALCHYRICWLFIALFLPTLPAVGTEKIDNRDFAIDTCYPTKNEIAIAQTRASRFWAKRSSRFGAEPRFLAVGASKIFPSEVQDLWSKLINSETTASFFSNGVQGNSYSNLQLLGVMIYDTKTGRIVSNQGYICVDTPPRGRVARFGPYIARYIGWG
jgi:hypothetical protein